MPASPMYWCTSKVKRNDPTEELNYFREKKKFFQLDQFPGYVCSGLHDKNAGMKHWRNMIEMKENVGATTFSN